MPSDDNRADSERDQTDESLRVERERSDEVVAEQLARLDDSADAVISVARARADAVLAAARARSDRHRANTAPGSAASKTVREARSREDDAVRDERADADATLRTERVAHASGLAIEREETDRDLSSERARSDHSLATRDEFLGIVSHELRNMLNAVVGYAALIATDVSQPDHVARVLVHAQRIQRSGGRMHRLVGDLVDVASIEAGTLDVTREPGDPVLIVTEAVDTFAAHAVTNGISLRTDFVAPLPRVPFDPARILQVLANLIGNAIKFSRRPGTVTVRIEQLGPDVRFSVTDTGPGIPTDKLEAVFERFLQLNPGDRRGVGLGLYISKCIVQGHGGRIWAESRVGEGATIAFTLPLDASR